VQFFERRQSLKTASLHALSQIDSKDLPLLIREELRKSADLVKEVHRARERQTRLAF